MDILKSYLRILLLTFILRVKKIAKELMRYIAAQVEELESKFDRNPDGSEKWQRLISEPIEDQYGQIWMIWKNSATSSSNPKDRYQVYKIPNDEDEFRYAFIEDLEVDRYPRYHKTLL